MARPFPPRLLTSLSYYRIAYKFMDLRDEYKKKFVLEYSKLKELFYRKGEPGALIEIEPLTDLPQ